MKEILADKKSKQVEEHAAAEDKEIALATFKEPVQDAVNGQVAAEAKAKAEAAAKVKAEA